MSTVDEFRQTVEGYFEVPYEPHGRLRHRPTTTPIRKPDDTEYRNFGDFSVFNYDEPGGIRVNGTPFGAVLGLSLPAEEVTCVAVFSDLEDDENLYREVVVDVDGSVFSRQRFRHPLTDSQHQSALEIAADPRHHGPDASELAYLDPDELKRITDLSRQLAIGRQEFAEEMARLEQMEREAYLF